MSNVVKGGVRHGGNYKKALESYLAAANDIRKMAEAYANKEYPKVLERLESACENLKNVKEFLKYA